MNQHSEQTHTAYSASATAMRNLVASSLDRGAVSWRISWRRRGPHPGYTILDHAPVVWEDYSQSDDPLASCAADLYLLIEQHTASCPPNHGFDYCLIAYTDDQAISELDGGVRIRGLRGPDLRAKSGGVADGPYAELVRQQSDLIASLSGELEKANKALAAERSKSLEGVGSVHAALGHVTRSMALVSEQHAAVTSGVYTEARARVDLEMARMRHVAVGKNVAEATKTLSNFLDGPIFGDLARALTVRLSGGWAYLARFVGAAVAFGSGNDDDSSGVADQTAGIVTAMISGDSDRVVTACVNFHVAWLELPTDVRARVPAPIRTILDSFSPPSI